LKWALPGAPWPAAAAARRRASAGASPGLRLGLSRPPGLDQEHDEADQQAQKAETNE